MFSGVRGLRFNNCQNVAFGHDQHFFIVDLLRFHTVAIVENNDVANFHIQRLHFAIFKDTAIADSQHFAAGGFSRCRAGQNDAASRFSFKSVSVMGDAGAYVVSRLVTREMGMRLRPFKGEKEKKF